MANISELSVLLKANTKQAQGQMQGFGKSVGDTFNKMKVGIFTFTVVIFSLKKNPKIKIK